LNDSETTRSLETYGEKGSPALFERTKKRTCCRRYRALLEENSFHAGGAVLEVDAELSAHAWGCIVCSKALTGALLAADFMSHAREPTAEFSDVFATRVMATIRKESARQTALSAIWRPLELLALRFVLAALVVLALLSYLAEFAAPRHASEITSETEVGAGFLEPPAQPANKEEVLVSLAGSDTEF